MKTTKQKIAEILLTAIISAGIAFLQSWLTSLHGVSEPVANPLTAGAIGTAIHGYRQLYWG